MNTCNCGLTAGCEICSIILHQSPLKLYPEPPENEIRLYGDAYIASPPNTLELNKSGKPLFTISADGRLTFGDGMSTDEASRGAVEILLEIWEEQIHPLRDALATIERIKALPDKWRLELIDSPTDSGDGKNRGLQYCIDELDALIGNG